MNLKEKLQQLALERQNLQIALYEISGAMKNLEQQNLETVKNYKKLDGTTSIWTSEDFTAIDAAIVAGKKLY